MADQSTSIFERMSALARETGAINLGQGFPDLPEPAELLEAAQRALVEKSNQYPPMRGLAELRRAVCDHYRREQGLELRDEQVIVTSGATEALAAAILAFVRPGDEAVVFQPCYDAYIPLIERAGGIARTVPLAPPRWTLPLDRLEATIGPKTRLVILNTPNNPTGTVIDRETLEGLAFLCTRYDLVLLCDEVWEAMLFGGAVHLSPRAGPGGRAPRARRRQRRASGRRSGPASPRSGRTDRRRARRGTPGRRAEPRARSPPGPRTRG